MKNFKLKFNCFTFEQFEDEENWLNEMSKQGWQLTHSYGLFYTFRYDEAKEYEYKLQYIPGGLNNKKQKEYLNFLNNMGIENVSHYLNWAYFRKEKSNEKFELFSDEESIKKHIDGIVKFITPAAYINLFCALINIPIGIINILQDSRIGLSNLCIGITNLLLFVLINASCKRLGRTFSSKKNK